MSVDVRTRVDGEQAPVDPARFFERDLPAALDAAAPLLAEAAPRSGSRPRGRGRRCHSGRWRRQRAGIEVRPGAPDGDGALRLRLDAWQLSDLVDDQVTPMGWFSSGALDLTVGSSGSWTGGSCCAGALDGVAPHVAQEMAFEDPRGGPWT